ncbi:MAG: UDP-3-O-acyl-N-acetylglucosamine deacetylase [Kiritimatiellae bacterium]|nr:UDP-3-O-acyl-N-acetylglucosamine deacetylase [Kiritimatiellia bacterium]
MENAPYGKIIAGSGEAVRRAYDSFLTQPVDQVVGTGQGDLEDERQCTIARPVSVTGPGTFFRRAARTLIFEPAAEQGWWFERTDLPRDLPTAVSVRNVWTTARNIVLRSGSPHNYMRMVEHIIALKLGLGIDNLLIKAASGDPPLFDRGSMDIVEALESAGTREQKAPVAYVTVKETVTIGGENGGFLTFIPHAGAARKLTMDCAIDFKNAIGKQRVQFDLTKKLFRAKALARTNTTTAMKLYCLTVGQLFADIRNMGYTSRNILIAGKKRYLNAPRLMQNGKSLEAVWHRAVMDLLAAVALIDRGRFIGRINSYKSGHALDADMVRLLYKHDLLTPV